MCRLIIALFVFVSAGSAIAQDIISDVGKVNDAYLNKQSLSYSITYKAYSNDGVSEAPEIIKGKYTMKAGNKFRNEISDVIIIQDGKNHIFCDNVEDVIIIKEAESSNFKDISPLNLTELVQMSQSINKITKNDLVGYSMSFGDNIGFSQLTFLYNPSDYLLREITIVHQAVDGDEISSQDEKIEILFSEYKVNEEISDDIFSISGIVTKASGSWKGIGTFASYQIYEDFLKK